ncbi:recombinase RecT [Nocardia otitidiscaviarum]|uniref:recombinase RecT n=1 Tax=Nocardia otitidiscaviarum TaxID=1823 RepID=UPI002455617F|nr:recombinase RecT [Nocardia otitidiscaviarum]
MNATPTTQAIAKQDNTPGGMIKTYQADFSQVMPAHIRPDTWVRIAQSALKKGRKQGGRYELELAAANNPGVFLATLLDAARLGLEPGTHEYYLTARKVKGQLEILGIPGYLGLIKLIYNAGAVSSVVAECVYSHDKFSYHPGRDEVPTHEIDWDAEDRGNLRLVYAYARMKDGAISKVVVLGKHDIKRIKESSQGSDSDYSPWKKHEAAMWLKSAVRQLSKWVPTSTEIRNDAKVVESERLSPSTFTAPALDEVDPVLEGELVDDSVKDAPASYYDAASDGGMFPPDPEE